MTATEIAPNLSAVLSRVIASERIEAIRNGGHVSDAKAMTTADGDDLVRVSGLRVIAV